MKAIIISPEGLEKELVQGTLYSLGGQTEPSVGNLENIQIKHPSVAPNHVRISYETESNSWIVKNEYNLPSGVERYGRYQGISQGTSIPLQNNDFIILGDPKENGAYSTKIYRIRFKEFSDPFPKQRNPPRPIAESLNQKIKGSDKEIKPLEVEAIHM